MQAFLILAFLLTLGALMYTVVRDLRWIPRTAGADEGDIALLEVAEPAEKVAELPSAVKLVTPVAGEAPKADEGKGRDVSGPGAGSLEEAARFPASAPAARPAYTSGLKEIAVPKPDSARLPLRTENGRFPSAVRPVAAPAPAPQAPKAATSASEARESSRLKAIGRRPIRVDVATKNGPVKPVIAFPKKIAAPAPSNEPTPIPTLVAATVAVDAIRAMSAPAPKVPEPAPVAEPAAAEPAAAATAAAGLESGGPPTNAGETILIGVELGTTRSVAVASNGFRATVPSVVGYPKDEVARKLAGASVLVGDAACRRRLALDIVEPIKDGRLADKPEAIQAAAEILGHLVKQVKGLHQGPVQVVVGVPPDSSEEVRRSFIRAARAVADGVVLAARPFAVGYGLGRMQHALVLDIGSGRTDLCRLCGRIPEASDFRTVNVGGDHVDAELERRLHLRYQDAQFTRNMVRKFKEAHGFVGQNSDKVFVRMPVDGRPVDHDITDDLQAACAAIVGPLAAALREFIAEYDPEFQDKFRQNVVLTGGGSGIRGLDKALTAALQEMGGGRVSRVEEPVFGVAEGALKLAEDVPSKVWGIDKDRAAAAPATRRIRAVPA